MKVSTLPLYTSNYQSTHNLGLSQNRQKQIDAQNAHTGGHYSLSKENAASQVQVVEGLFA